MVLSRNVLGPDIWSTPADESARDRGPVEEEMSDEKRD
jgi:hypothetical protein